jgi:hypothetical protein
MFRVKTRGETLGSKSTFLCIRVDLLPSANLCVISKCGTFAVICFRLTIQLSGTNHPERKTHSANRETLKPLNNYQDTGYQEFKFLKSDKKPSDKTVAQAKKIRFMYFFCLSGPFAPQNHFASCLSTPFSKHGRAPKKRGKKKLPATSGPNRKFRCIKSKLLWFLARRENRSAALAA